MSEYARFAGTSYVWTQLLWTNIGKPIKCSSEARWHSGYITVVEPYQLLCYWSNFSKMLLASWFEIQPQRYDFHSAKQPMI